MTHSNHVQRKAFERAQRRSLVESHCGPGSPSPARAPASGLRGQQRHEAKATYLILLHFILDSRSLLLHFIQE